MGHVQLDWCWRERPVRALRPARDPPMTLRRTRMKLIPLGCGLNLYSITSSAPLISEAENSSPRALAAFRLMMNSSLVTS
jgi:hypothetical protein